MNLIQITILPKDKLNFYFIEKVIRYYHFFKTSILYNFTYQIG